MWTICILSELNNNTIVNAKTMTFFNLCNECSEFLQLSLYKYIHLEPNVFL